jgi:hypothetical protein
MSLRHRRSRSRTRRPKSSVAKYRRRIAPPEALEKRLVLDSTVVFNEIMYNPLDDPNDGLEWIELHNQLAVDMDISDWHLEGGVDYTFPDGTIVPGKGYLVVAANPDLLKSETNFGGAIGPFTGRLSNGGEELRLINNDGRRMNVIDYGDSGDWPVAPDGGGASLTKRDEQTASEPAENWTHSFEIGGTPGAANFVGPGDLIFDTLIPAGAAARAFVPGDGSLATTWTARGFDDGEWTTGTTGVGYDTGSNYNSLLGLDLDAPPNNQPAIPIFGSSTTVYVRVPFQLNEDPQQFDSIVLRMQYDDGFVAYLNGVEVAHRFAPGRDGNNDPLNWSSPATANHSDNDAVVFQPFDITQFRNAFVQGVENVLAIHGLNDGTGSSDMLFRPELVGARMPEVPSGPDGSALMINEVAAATEAEFWLELSNDSSQSLELGGVVIAASGGGGSEYVLPAQTLLAGGRLSITEQELGFHPADGDKLFVYSSSKQGLLDARVVTNSLRGRSEQHDGRWLWPDVPSPGTANSFAFQDQIVINEIMYHAPPQLRTDTQPYLKSDEEWIELYNRGNEAVDLSGWQLRDAINFEFDAGTMLGPGEYLVVAWDAIAMAAKFPGINIAGSFSGGLSNTDERILLRDAFKNPADEVHYFERGKWAEFADGGGSSLELRDPDSDNSQGIAWAASDESDGSEWIDYSYSAGASEPLCCGNDFRELVFGLLDSGEFLIDNVVVRDGNGPNMIQNGTFQGDSIGSTPANWRFNGNHSGSIVADPENAANRVLHVVTSGAHQHVNDNIDINLTSSVDSSTHTISFRIKWITGSAQINSRLFFTRMSNTAIMELPTQLGTPGARNSAFESNIGPTYSEFSHFPLLPASNEPVTVSARPSDPDGVTSMNLWWSNNGGNWSRVTMTNAGDGMFIGTIPSQSSNTRIQFYVEGQDTLGALSTFPARGRDSRAMYLVRPETARQIDTFRLVLRSSDENALTGGNRFEQMSNRYVGTTLIVNGETAFYDVELRMVGSGFIRPSSGYKVKLDPEQRFYGVHDSLRFDANGTSEIVYKQMVNRAGGSSVSLYDDVAYLASGSLPVTNRNVLLNLARYEDVFLDEQFENGSDGTKFELDDVTHPSGGPPHNNRDMAAMDVRNLGASNPEVYRGQLLIKNNRAKDNLASMAAFSQAIHTKKPDNRGEDLTVGGLLDVATQEVLDVDLWMRHYATQAFIGNWDSYGFNRPKNIRIYVRPDDGKIMPMFWDADLANLSSQNLIYNGGSSRLDEIRNIPTNTRLFWGHMLDLVDRAFNVQYASAWNSRYSSLGASTISISRLTTQVNRAESQARSAIPEIDFRITTNSGNAFSTGSASTVLRGDGWIDVREIRLAGSEEPLEVKWTDNNSWEIDMPLAEGANELDLEAYNFRGELIATDSIIVTSTSDSQRVADVLRISELNYNPYDPPTSSSRNNDDFEFIELVNTGSESIDLRGVEFTNGVTFAFTGSNVTSLGAGEHVLVVSDLLAFNERYDVASGTIAGVYTGALNNGGERLTLEDSFGTTIVTTRFNDSGVWPNRPDGGGSTLEIVDAFGDYDDGRNWRSSTEYGGSPGTAGEGPINSVVVNEVLSHTDVPLHDAIELFNPTGQPINIGGWFLSDTNDNYAKFRIPANTILNPGAYIFFDETHFNSTGLDLDPLNDDPNDFALNGAHGDDVWLLSADAAGNLTRFIDRVEFEAGVNGESFGRWPNGSGNLFPMTERTLGEENSGPRFGPVIFSEIMFHPELPPVESGLDANDLEFIEIYNSSTSAVSLENWEIGKGVDYRFPNDATIGAGESLVILSFNPENAANAEKLAAVMAAYTFAPDTMILGGYAGSLDNTGERLRLFRPDAPPTDEPGFIPLLVEDELRFSPLAPWPTGASLTGESLTRQSEDAWSSEPTNWQAAAPTPGSTTFSVSIPADLTGNGFVDFQDLTILLAHWNQSVSAAEGNLIDELGTPVNFQDLTVLLAAWTGPGGAASPQAATGAPVGRRLAAAVGGDSVADIVGANLESNSERETPRRARRDSINSRPTRGTYGRLQAAAVDRAMADEAATFHPRRRISMRRR